jgi:hypothetical protein
LFDFLADDPLVFFGIGPVCSAADMAFCQSIEPIEIFLRGMRGFPLSVSESGRIFLEPLVADLFAIQKSPMLAPVSDTTNQHNTDADGEEEARAKFMAAQERFRDSFTQFIDAALEYGSVTGWLQGFDRGWDAAFEYLKTPMSDVKAAAIKSHQPDKPVQPPLPLMFLGPDADKDITAADVVYDYIRANPGKRGVEIATAMEERVPPIPERTVRTALHRLRHQAEKIKNVDGKWYAADHDPIRRL